LAQTSSAAAKGRYIYGDLTPTGDAWHSLIELKDHPGLPILLQLIRKTADTKEREVLGCSLETNSIEELAFKKCRAEGAKYVSNFIHAIFKKPG